MIRKFRPDLTFEILIRFAELKFFRVTFQKVKSFEKCVNAFNEIFVAWGLGFDVRPEFALGISKSFSLFWMENAVKRKRHPEI